MRKTKKIKKTNKNKKVKFITVFGTNYLIKRKRGRYWGYCAHTFTNLVVVVLQFLKKMFVYRIFGQVICLDTKRVF